MAASADVLVHISSLLKFETDGFLVRLGSVLLVGYLSFDSCWTR